MPETAEELHARAAGALSCAPPADEERAAAVRRRGRRLQALPAADDDYLWTGERWRLWSGFDPPPGLPFVALLEPRKHFAAPGDLPDDLAAELGVLIARIERAVCAVGEIGRVHVCRWGDGSEHLHWWFMARPARLPQVRGTFAAIWDDVLPPLPDDLWRANLSAVAAAAAAETAV